MTADLKMRVEVNDNRLVLKLEQFPETLKRAIRGVIRESMDTLLNRVIALEPRRTGYLQSQTHSYVDERKDWIRGRVRIIGTGRARRVGAAFAALEYGAHRSFRVKAYRRRSGPVRSYERRANIHELRFLRGPYTAMRQHIAERLREAVTQAFKE